MQITFFVLLTNLNFKMEDVESTSHPQKKRKLDVDTADSNDKESNSPADGLTYVSAAKFQEISPECEGENEVVQTELARPRPISSKVNCDEDQSLENKDNDENNQKQRECDVGITEYINEFPGIPGILKQRYSDFVVRERNLAGNLVQFIKNKNGEVKNLGSTTDRQDESRDETKNDNCPLSDEDVAKINEFVSKKGTEECDSHVILSADNDKNHRTLVHQFIRQTYDDLDTEVVEVGNGDKAIKIFFKKKSNKRRRGKSSSQGKQKYCHFVLYKENRDTMSAINKIAEVLHVRPSIFSYAGTKDKRAITIQQVCASRTEAERLLSINERVKNISIGSCTYRDSPLKLGDLRGNHFSIVLRDVPSGIDKEQIRQVMSSLKEVGFINYFGMQRFGSGSVPTYEIGKTILQSNWSQTISLILTPREGEEKTFSEAKKHWLEHKDSKEALKILNRRRCIEGQVLEGLAKLGENAYYNAFQNLPRNTRLLYLHSYQSYVWNRVVSERIAKYGLKVLAGDLVVHQDAENNATAFDTKDQKQSLTRCKVKHITQDDVDSGAYSITDIVMPLPGYDMTYPENALKDLYTTIIANDGLSLGDMKHKVKDYSLSGAYRYVIVKPKNVDWRIVNYDDYCIPLIQTEIDIIEGRNPPDLDAAGEHRALKVEFTLPPSSYATMVIREITKLDSSANQQSKLNNKS